MQLISRRSVIGAAMALFSGLFISQEALAATGQPVTINVGGHPYTGQASISYGGPNYAYRTVVCSSNTGPNNSPTFCHSGETVSNRLSLFFIDQFLMLFALRCEPRYGNDVFHLLRKDSLRHDHDEHPRANRTRGARNARSVGHGTDERKKGGRGTGHLVCL